VRRKEPRVNQLTDLNLAARFFLELCMLAALAYWGYQLDAATPLRWGAASAAPLLAAVVWGTFLSPKAAVSINLPAQLALEVAVFASAAAALAASGRLGVGLTLAVSALLNRALMGLWGQ
jgi:hypothetical protein